LKPAALNIVVRTREVELEDPTAWTGQ